MTGRKVLSCASKRVGDKYILGALAPKNDPNYRGPWDCAELVTWSVYQVSDKLYGCAKNDGNPSSADAYTGFWKRDADKLGKIITVNEAASIPGAIVLRYAGSGLIGHIAISDGKGGTVEAANSKKGVIYGKISGRRWDIGILVPWITYVESKPVVPIKPPKGVIYRFTDPLMQGPKVKEIQLALNSYGAKLKADGVYGSKTFYAVRSFQWSKGLVADGEVGTITARALGICL